MFHDISANISTFADKIAIVVVVKKTLIQTNNFVTAYPGIIVPL